MNGPEAGNASTVDSDVRRQLERADSQLALYARDLKRLFDSERKKSRDLAEANDKLRILDRLKTDFLSFISHELRTPLTVLSNIELLDPEGGSKDQARLTGMLRRAYQRLNRLVERGLDYFNWIGGERIIPGETTDLTSLVRELPARIPALKELGQGYSFSHPDHPCTVPGREDRILQVMEILIENGLKFSLDEKRLSVDLRVVEGKAVLVVADRGKGFPPEMGKEIFKPFTVVDIDHHQKGTGLSLALAAAIVEAHGGRIRGESEGTGRGARFSFDLPVLAKGAAGGATGSPGSPAEPC